MGEVIRRSNILWKVKERLMEDARTAGYWAERNIAQALEANHPVAVEMWTALAAGKAREAATFAGMALGYAEEIERLNGG